MEKLILTIDVDAFFASCEEKLNPRLKQKSIAIGHFLNNKGVVTTCNYNARKFGVRSGMPMYKAKKLCEKLEIIEPKFFYYSRISEQIFQIIKNFGKTIEVTSIDECYLDITTFCSKEEIISYCKKIQNEIYKKVELTVSIGASTNKVLAKIASNFNKPNGISTLFKEEIPTKLWTLPIQKMHFLGKQTTKLFNLHNIYYLSEVANLQKNSILYDELKKVMGIRLDMLINFSNGISEENVNNEYHELKSISNVKTFPIDIVIVDEAKQEIVSLVDIVWQKVQRRYLKFKVLGIMYSKAKNDHTTKRISVEKFINSKEQFFSYVMFLFDKYLLNKLDFKIRSFGVFVANLVQKDELNLIQNSFFDSNIDLNKKFIDCLPTLITSTNNLFGKKIITTLDEISRHKKYIDKNLNTNDRVKFKVWDK